MLVLLLPPSSVEKYDVMGYSTPYIFRFLVFGKSWIEPFFKLFIIWMIDVNARRGRNYNSGVWF